MKPRHFWWLVDRARGPQSKRDRLSKSDKDAIREALRGNPQGDFW